ncbi:hypothetical protein PSACC_01753 [Paramicrosporidium saccamoebae]|uniref:BSD domain-containing protein n=1 Tax=Paramicrosporidium saccamoebae TaxID=1246581 RepID=A0A2H9TL06_9FUNG|nr:hypothetical protein PSACC_01753 [Paramicrosporidium saccamoebae]
MGRQLSAEEIRLRGTLLGSNKELLQLHRTLVRGGLLSEEEFWETRQNLLKDQETLLRQKKPLPSILGDDLCTSAEYQSENKIILTPETIQAILAQNPAVQRAYHDNVPKKMNERDFWTFYVKSRFFKKSATSPNEEEHNPLNDYYEETTSENVEQVMGGTRLSRLVDITSTVEDRISDRTAEHLRSQQGDESLSLIRKFNNHSLRIVQSASGSAPPLRIEDTLEYEDLTAEPEVKSQSLELGTGRVGFSAPLNAERPLVEPQFRESLCKVELDTLSFVKKSLCTFEQRRDLFTPYNAHLSENDVSPSPETIPVDVELFHNNSAEVLRHFWVAHPAGRDAEKQAKLARMTTILEQLLIKGRELVSLRKTIQEQAWTEQTLFAIFTAIEHALGKGTEHGSKKPKIEI